jgi:hypothetical protein
MLVNNVVAITMIAYGNIKCDAVLKNRITLEFDRSQGTIRA